MDRINDPTAEADKFGAGKDGFTEGDGGLVLPTRVRSPWLDGVQEELLGLIEGMGVTPDSGDFTQLSSILLQPAASFEIFVASGSSPQDATFALIEQNKAGHFTVASGDEEIAPLLAGTYLVTVHLRVISDSTADPLQFSAFISTDDGAAATRFILKGARWSATPAHRATLSGSALMQLSDSVGLRLLVDCSVGSTIESPDASGSDDYENHIHVVRVGPAAP